VFEDCLASGERSLLVEKARVRPLGSAAEFACMIHRCNPLGARAREVTKSTMRPHVLTGTPEPG
jgi:hypothetical protein